jgi:uncharacterized protein
MGNPVVHFEIMGKDSAALRSFYGNIFGWQFSPVPGANGAEYALAEPKADGGIKGGIGTAPEGYDGHLTFYVAVPNLEDALAKVEELGGSTMMEPVQVPNGPRIALFLDPENRTVGLVEP